MSLELKKVTKCYGKKVVLDNLDLTLEEGKIYGLVGRNGAGKTTMLSIASAQNPATEGEILLNGERVWENQKVLNEICFSREMVNCQTAHCGRGKPHFDFGNNISPIVRYRHLLQTLIGMTVDCCSLV